jgi:hypothetical protein
MRDVSKHAMKRGRKSQTIGFLNVSLIAVIVKTRLHLRSFIPVANATNESNCAMA